MDGPASPTRRFENRVAQRAMAGFAALLIVFGLGGLLADSSRWQGVFILVFGAASLARALRSSSVEVDASGVTTRSMVRTRRHEFGELSHVTIAVGRTGLASGDREYPVFHRVDGQAIAFKELNGRPSAGPASVVRRAVGAVDEHLIGR